MPKSKWNALSFRRILIDMQIPDWDPAFLANYDVRASLDAVVAAGADAVMVYFQSHTGLCNWPTASGSMHGAFHDRDMVAETLAWARQQELPLCAYYSVNFNNQAAIDHADWRLKPAQEGMIGGGALVRERYGLCCLNHPAYRAFIKNQIEEVLTEYEINALFYDMVWWMGVCLCDRCRERYRNEEFAEIPEAIDWLDPLWCRYQAARERWLTEFASWLSDLARKCSPDITVYHNFAVGMMNWTRGVSFASAAAQDFLGGDFYGGRDEQLVVSKLMINLSPSLPVEFMTTATVGLAEHETLKPPAQLAQQSLAASACGAAILTIAGIDPDGGLNQAAFDLIKQAFAARQPWDSELGGVPVEQIAVYFSDSSKMSFEENGRPLSESQSQSPLDYPHFSALRGACRKLQRAHLPFGVITHEQLDQLNRYRIIILPDVLRMSQAEAEAFRSYVQGGGHLYASRYTSLTDTQGTRYDDFMLADLFGCHYDSVERGRMVYLDPQDAECSAAIAPQRYLCQIIDSGDDTGLLRLRPLDKTSRAQVLATLNVPYGHPSFGSVNGKDWSSIHSSPPWHDTGTPALVRHQVGAGRVVYSAADIETGEGAANERLFIALIRDLLSSPPAFDADAHPEVWLTVFDQPERQRWLVSLLNYTVDLPVNFGRATIRLSSPPGYEFTGVTTLPGKEPLDVRRGANGMLEVELASFEMFAMLAANYRKLVDE